MMRAPQMLFLLVDGLGLGSRDPAVNPLRRGVCPCLERLLDREAVAIDASLGVPGVPQSATGQTTLLTGVNAALVVGRHVEGFPGPALRAVIREHNLFDQLAALGCRCTFANAYFVHDMAAVASRRIQSVTTVAALKAFGAVRDSRALAADRAVYQDLTRESLRDRGYDGPLVAPEEAARHLAALAAGYEFTLFEYFQTDRAGHKGGPEGVVRVLGLLDRFLAALLPFAAPPGRLLVLTSDHGNIEEEGSPRHTTHPVPFVALGEGAAGLRRRVRSLTDVAPAVVAFFRAAAAEGGFAPGSGSDLSSTGAASGGKRKG